MEEGPREHQTSLLRRYHDQKSLELAALSGVYFVYNTRYMKGALAYLHVS